MTWKPSKAQRREFAIRMQDPQEKSAYEERKRARAEKRRSQSQFDYASAGGSYVPTEAQYNYAMFDRSQERTDEDKLANEMVASGYACNIKVDHDYIHLVNEQIRRKS